MNNLSFDRSTLLTIALGLATICIPVFLYFYLIYPLNAQIDLQQQQLENEQQLVSVLLTQPGDRVDETLRSSAELQKQIPVKPLIEQLILDMEKAELLSNSFIESIAITETEVLATSLQPEQTGEMINPIETPSEGNAAAPDEAEPDVAVVDPIQPNLVPEGLFKVSMSLAVQSSSYFELQQFLTVIEDLPRIIEVEQIGFTDGGEVTSLNDSREALTYSVTVAAYYYPALDELISELPIIDAPPPADKSNPLTQFPGETEDEEDPS